MLFCEVFLCCVSKVNPVVSSDDATGDNGGVVVNDPHYRQGTMSFHAIDLRA